MCCSSVRSPTPSHTQPFQIKWEVYLSRNCIVVIIVSLWFCMHLHMAIQHKLRGPFNAKAILVEQKWYYLTQSWGIRRFDIFTLGIHPKVNLIALLEFELAYFEASVKHVSYYAKEIPHLNRVRQTDRQTLWCVCFNAVYIWKISCWRKINRVLFYNADAVSYNYFLILNVLSACITSDYIIEPFNTFTSTSSNSSASDFISLIWVPQEFYKFLNYINLDKNNCL